MTVPSSAVTTSSSDAVLAAARHELDASATNVGFARVVVDGLVAGSVWCDREHAPRAFHVVHPYGMSLVFGAHVDEVVDEVRARVRGRARPAAEWLQVDSRWHHLDWEVALGAVSPAPGEPAQAGEDRVERYGRRSFSFVLEDFLMSRPAAQPTDGVRCRLAEDADFGIAGTVVPRAFWRDAAGLREHGGAVVVEHAGEVAAVAFASYRWDDQVEIGIETLPGHRRQGHGRVAAAAMVDIVLDSGLTPVWSCREGNVGSERLARSVGFAPTTVTPYYRVGAEVRD